MYKEMPVIPVNRVVDKERIIGKGGTYMESLTSPQKKIEQNPHHLNSRMK
jgi:hypothetical protein